MKYENGELFPTYFDECLLLHRLLHDESYEASPEDKAWAQAAENALLCDEPEPDSPRSSAQMAAEAFQGFTVQYPEIWAKIHAKLADHGFILRYLDGKEAITGYSYEPWHIRYVNDVTIAKEIMDKGITLEEYLGKMPTTDVAPPKDE